jgi:hypothetical protein
MAQCTGLCRAMQPITNGGIRVMHGRIGQREPDTCTHKEAIITVLKHGESDIKPMMTASGAMVTEDMAQCMAKVKGAMGIAGKIASKASSETQRGEHYEKGTLCSHSSVCAHDICRSGPGSTAGSRFGYRIWTSRPGLVLSLVWPKYEARHDATTRNGSRQNARRTRYGTMCDQ